MDNPIAPLTERVSSIVDALANAFLQGAETAAERIQLAAQVAAVQAKMAAFGSVLEAIAAQKEALQGRLGEAAGPMKTLIARQLEVLAAQELAVLASAGIPTDQAAQAIQVADERVYRREGSKFVQLPLPGLNSNGRG